MQYLQHRSKIVTFNAVLQGEHFSQSLALHEHGRAVFIPELVGEELAWMSTACLARGPQGRSKQGGAMPGVGDLGTGGAICGAAGRNG